MKRVAVSMAAIAIAVGAASCQQDPQRRAIQIQKEMMAAQMEAYKAMAETWEGQGVAEVILTPPEAVLWVDGGEYVGDRSNVVVQVGTHAFKAQWPDGTTLERKVYIPPASVTMNFSTNYEEHGGGGSANVKTTDSKVTKTPVRLTKPAPDQE